MGDGLWEVLMQPVGRGIVVYVTDGKIKSVVGRVSYDRWKSGNPFRTFKGQLLSVVERAEGEADDANARPVVVEREEGMGTVGTWTP